jgi:hypothetical protein
VPGLLLERSRGGFQAGLDRSAADDRDLRGTGRHAQRQREAGNDYLNRTHDVPFEDALTAFPRRPARGGTAASFTRQPLSLSTITSEICASPTAAGGCAATCSITAAPPFTGTTRSPVNFPSRQTAGTGLFWQNFVLEQSPMKKSRFTESQIVAILTEGEAGAAR